MSVDRYMYHTSVCCAHVGTVQCRQHIEDMGCSMVLWLSNTHTVEPPNNGHGRFMHFCPLFGGVLYVEVFLCNHFSCIIYPLWVMMYDYTIFRILHNLY